MASVKTKQITGTPDMNVITPMLKQYFSIKEENPDTILLFRVGDFYECYHTDAELISRDLDIILTSKDAGKGQRVYMAGVPYHSVNPYIKTLVTKGYRVAICEQVEDARFAKGLVKREVVKTITAGTILDPDMLKADENNYLLGLSKYNNLFAVAVADISTGELSGIEFEEYDRTKLLDEVKRLNPSEIVIDSTVTEEKLVEQLKNLSRNYFKYDKPLNYKELDAHIPDTDNYSQALKQASGVIINYLKDTQKTTQLNLDRLTSYSQQNYMILDNTTLRNLEIVKTLLTGEKEGSLLSVIDKTSTSMGARTLRNIIERPLTDVQAVKDRQSCVKEIINGYSVVDEAKKLFDKVYDLERILAKIEYNTANARDLLALERSLEVFPGIKEKFSSFKSKEIKNLCENFDLLYDLHGLLSESLAENPPLTVREGGIIKDGYNKQLDDLRVIKGSSKKMIARLQEEERSRTGIKSLKVGFNSVFGYYIEVTKPNLPMVPENYIRKQTLANCERFINEKLKEYEAAILGAEEKIKNLEFELFNNIRGDCAKAAKRIKNSAKIIAYLDVLVNFAYIAVNNNYSCPVITDDDKIIIKEGRHPVIEKTNIESFTPNDLYLDSSDNKLILITGPNMAGKSTFLRQTALIAILAQSGCFVPAKEASIGIIDRIFTRVGASDDLHLGQSTFMVEMAETANILTQASSRSLVILDEVGRGTSTKEGLSLAQSIVEYIHNNIGAKTLFATHFHELTQLENHLAGVKNYKTVVKETGSEIIFLHKVVPGGTDKSFALYVAHLAGIPKTVIERSAQILDEIEQGYEKVSLKTEGKTKQLSFLEEEASHPVIEEIKSLDAASITPIEALNKIHSWQEKIKKL
ncbi:MAG: DNA mismatch repair protein MutS [Armatimonadota bacterium]